MSQPAVSQQIRQLEQNLGRALFERAGPVVRLTEDGHGLAVAVNDGLGRIDYELAKFRRRSNDNCLEVRANSAFVTWWLLPRLGGFLDAHPEIEIDLTTSYWAEFPRADGAPVHIDFGPVPDGAELVVGPQHMVAVARPDLATTIAEPADLAGATLLDVVGGDGWRHFLSGLDTTLEAWPRTHTSMTYLHTLDLARMGRGVALAADMIVENLLAESELAVVAGLQQPSREHYYLMLPSQRKLNSAATAFLDWLGAFRNQDPPH